MIHYRNMAEWLGLSFDCNLEGIPAVAEDMICDGILGRDPYFVGDKGKSQ